MSEACADLLVALPWTIKWLLYLGLIAVALHLLVELATAIAKLRTTPAARDREGPDPVKAIDALKALLEALTNAPTWIAIFVLAMALWLVAQGAKPAFCDPAPTSGGSGMTAPAAVNTPAPTPGTGSAGTPRSQQVRARSCPPRSPSHPRIDQARAAAPVGLTRSL